jgi:threonine dehydrogenase-like Zn-dependent dehydrogenase
MKAAVYYGPGDMRVQDMPRPKANPEGAVLKVEVCGVCNILDAAWWRSWPANGQGIGLIRGHEWSGSLVEVGSEVTDFKVGDKIFIEPVYRPCYTCEACKLKDYWRCINWMHGEAGRAIHGAFAEYLAIPFLTKLNALKIKSKLNYRDLSGIEAIGLGIGMARRVVKEKTVVVLGMDLIGLGAVASLKRRGVPKVIVSDISQKRLKAAEDAGADVIIDELKEDVIKRVMKETRGLGADVVMQSDDRPIVTFQAMNIVRTLGKIWTTRNSFLRLNPNIVSMKPGMTPTPAESSIIYESAISLDPAMASMTSGFSYGQRLSRFQEAVDIMESGKCTAEKVVTHVFPLDKINEAFDVAMDPHESIKVIIEP